MPANPLRSTATRVVIEHTTHTIKLVRTLSAPREQVFEAWTQPEQVTVWWDPSGAPLKACQIDLRPGGGFSFTNQGPGDVPPFSGVYREIDSPEHLVFEAMGSIGRVLLQDLGGHTLMTVTIECGSQAQLDQFVAMGVDIGTSQTLDNLVAYAASIGR